MIIDKEDILGCRFEEGSEKITCFNCMFHGNVGDGFIGIKGEDLLTTEIEATGKAYICDFCSEILNRI